MLLFILYLYLYIYIVRVFFYIVTNNEPDNLTNSSIIGKTFSFDTSIIRYNPQILIKLHITMELRC